MKFRLLTIFLFAACVARAQTSVQFNLTDPQYNTSQTTGAVVTVQAWSTGGNGELNLLPLQLQQNIGTNSSTTFTNLFGGPAAGFYHWIVSIYNSSQRVQGNMWVYSTNLGTINEGLIDVVPGAPSYPAGTWCWSAIASELRYAQGSNVLASYVQIGQLANWSNSIVTVSSNFTASATNGFTPICYLPTNTYTTWAQATNLINVLANTNAGVSLQAVTNIAAAYYALNPSNYPSGGQFAWATNVITTNAQFNLSSTGALLTASINSGVILASNTAYGSAIGAIGLSNTIWQAQLAAGTSGVQGAIISVSNLLNNSKQPASTTLTNLSGTGAYTNIIAAGQNFSLTTNVSGNTTFLNATNQTFLTNGIVPGGPAFYPSNSYLPASILPGLTNGFLTIQATQTLASTSFVFSITSPLAPLNFLVASTNILWNNALSAFYPLASNPSGYITANAATSQFYSVTNPSNYQTANQVTNIANYYSTNATAVATNLSQFLFNAAMLAINTVNTNSTNYANTNTTTQIQKAIAGVGTNYIASTNGSAISLSIANSMLLGTATNFNYNTNFIQVRGWGYGTYVGAAFQNTWTNSNDTNLTFLRAGGFFFLQTNGGAIYQYNSQLQNGIAIGSAPLPVPWAAFDGEFYVDGMHFFGAPYWPWLQSEIGSSGASFVAPGQGLKNLFAGPTNVLYADTNYFVSLILEFASSPTNGISAATATNLILSIGGYTFEPLLGGQPWTNGNVFYTNVNLLTPFAGGAFWIPTNSTAGSGGNVYSNTSTFFNNLNVANVLAVTNIVAPGQSGVTWIGIANPIIGGQVGSVALGLESSSMNPPGGGAYGSVGMAGSLVTNVLQNNVYIHSDITNPYSSDFVENSSGVFEGPTANNQDLFFPGNGMAIGTNNPSGNELEVIGAANFSYITENGIHVLTNSSGGSQTPWTSDINANDHSLTNINEIISQGAVNSSILQPNNGGWNLRADESGSIDNVGYIGPNFNSPYNGGMMVSSSINGIPVYLNPDFASDDGNIVSDGAGNLTLGNLTNANVFSSGTVNAYELNSSTDSTTIASSAQVVSGDVQSSGAVNGNAYFLNGQPVSFMTNVVQEIWCTNCLGAATNYNGLYTLDVPAAYPYGYWTNHNGTTYAIAPPNPFFGLAIMCTNFPDATNGSPPLANQYVSFGKYGSVFGNWPIEFIGSNQATNGSPIVTVFAQTVPWPTTVTSSNSSIVVNASTNAGTINYDISAGAGASVYFKATQSSSDNIASRPAVQYTQNGGLYEKTNSAGATSTGWNQAVADQDSTYQGMPLQYNLFTTTPDGVQINGAGLTNVPITSINGLFPNFYNTNPAPLPAAGVGIQVGVNAITGQPIIQSTPYSFSYIETNFDSRNWTNQSSGGIFANQFTGGGAGLTSLTAANISAGTAGINITGNASGNSGASSNIVSGTAIINDPSLLPTTQIFGTANINNVTDPRAANSFGLTINSYLPQAGGSEAAMTDKPFPEKDSAIEHCPPIRIATAVNDSAKVNVDLQTNFFYNFLTNGLFGAATNCSVPVNFEIIDGTLAFNAFRSYSSGGLITNPITLSPAWDTTVPVWVHSYGARLYLQTYYDESNLASQCVIGGSSFTSNQNTTNASFCMNPLTYLNDFANIRNAGFDSILLSDVSPSFPNYVYDEWAVRMQNACQYVPQLNNYSRPYWNDINTAHGYAFSITNAFSFEMFGGQNWQQGASPFCMSQAEGVDIDDYPDPGTGTSNYMNTFRGQIFQGQVPFQSPGHWCTCFQFLNYQAGSYTAGSIDTILAGSIMSHESIYLYGVTNGNPGGITIDTLYPHQLTNDLGNRNLLSLDWDDGNHMYNVWDNGPTTSSEWARRISSPQINSGIAVWICNESASPFTTNILWSSLGLPTNAPYSVSVILGTNAPSFSAQNSFGVTLTNASSGLYLLTPQPIGVVTAAAPAQPVTYNLAQGPSPGIVTVIQTNANFTLSSFVPIGTGFSSGQLNVSNAAATAITVTIQNFTPYTPASTNALVIPAGTVGFIYADNVHGSTTNMSDAP